MRRTQTAVNISKGRDSRGGARGVLQASAFTAVPTGQSRFSLGTRATRFDCTRREMGAFGR